MGLNHIEVQILECVARLYSNIFTRLDDFCKPHRSFIGERIDTFECEIQFYAAYLDYIAVCITF